MEQITSEARTFTDSFEITNAHRRPVQLIVEPWAFVYEIKPGESIKCTAYSEQEGKWEVVTSDQQIVLYGWAGSAFRFYLNGALELDMNVVIPMPPI